MTSNTGNPPELTDDSERAKTPENSNATMIPKGTQNGETNSLSEASANLQHKTILLDHLNLITRFSGEESNNSFTDFMTSFMGIAKFLSWDEEDKIFALKTRLVGEAASIIKNHPETKKFDELKQILEERFVRRESPSIALQKFLSFKQVPGMRVKEFYAKASDMSYKALIYDGCDKKVTEQSRLAILKAMLLKNLAPEIRQGVVARDPESPEEILKYALREEKGWDSIREMDDLADMPPPGKFNTGLTASNFAYACATSMTDNQDCANNSKDVEIAFLKKQLNSLEKKLKDLSVGSNPKVPISAPPQKSTKTNPIQCHACLGFSHIARNCPNNINRFYDKRDIAENSSRYQRDTRSRGTRRSQGRYFPPNHERWPKNPPMEIPLPNPMGEYYYPYEKRIEESPQPSASYQNPLTYYPPFQGRWEESPQPGTSYQNPLAYYPPSQGRWDESPQPTAPLPYPFHYQQAPDRNFKPPPFEKAQEGVATQSSQNSAAKQENLAGNPVNKIENGQNLNLERRS